MAFVVQAKLEGLGPVRAKLAALRKGLRGKIVRKGMDEGTKPVLSSAKGLAPRDSGLLAKSMGRKTKVYRGSGNAVGLVGPRAGFAKQVTVESRKITAQVGTRRRSRKIGAVVNRDPVRYAHLVELGRKAVSATKKKMLVSAGGTFFGRKVRATPPRPFLGRSWQRSSGIASEKIRATIEAEISKAVAGGG